MEPLLVSKSRINYRHNCWRDETIQNRKNPSSKTNSKVYDLYWHVTWSWFGLIRYQIALGLLYQFYLINPWASKPHCKTVFLQSWSPEAKEVRRADTFLHFFGEFAKKWQKLCSVFWNLGSHNLIFSSSADVDFSMTSSHPRCFRLKK